MLWKVKIWKSWEVEAKLVWAVATLSITTRGLTMINERDQT